MTKHRERERQLEHKMEYFKAWLAEGTRGRKMVPIAKFREAMIEAYLRGRVDT